MAKTERIENIDNTIEKTNAQIDSITNEINELEITLQETIRDFAMEAEEETDVEKVKDLIAAKRDELKDKYELVERLQSVRKTSAVDEVPKVAGIRKRKLNKIKKEIDEQEEKVMQARNQFVRELAALGKIKNKVGAANDEYQQTMREIGEKVSEYDRLPITTKKLFSAGWTAENEVIGLTQQIQSDALNTGQYPHWLAVNQ